MEEEGQQDPTREAPYQTSTVEEILEFDVRLPS
jgi:hypothetical protein